MYIYIYIYLCIYTVVQWFIFIQPPPHHPIKKWLNVAVGGSPLPPLSPPIK